MNWLTKRPIGQVIQWRVMEQVKLADRQQQDTGSNIDWFIDQIVDKGKLKSGFDFI